MGTPSFCARVTSSSTGQPFAKARICLLISGPRTERATHLFVPALTGIALVTAANIVHTAIVLSAQPTYLMRPPWPPLPWTLTALLASMTVACIGGVLAERRNRALQHHQVIDVDELPGVRLP